MASHLRIRLAAGLLVSSLAVVGCGAEGGSDASGPTTTAGDSSESIATDDFSSDLTSDLSSDDFSSDLSSDDFSSDDFSSDLSSDDFSSDGLSTDDPEVADFVDTYEGACKAILDGSEDYKDAISELRSSGDLDLASAKAATLDFFDGMEEAMLAMADAEAPSGLEDFQDSISAARDDIVSAFSDLRRDVGAFTSLDQFSDLDYDDYLDFESDMDFPESLLADAPSCQTIDAS